MRIIEVEIYASGVSPDNSEPAVELVGPMFYTLCIASIAHPELCITLHLKKLMCQHRRGLPAQASVQVLNGSLMVSLAFGEKESENRAARCGSSENVLGWPGLRWNGAGASDGLGAGSSAKQEEARGKHAYA